MIIKIIHFSMLWVWQNIVCHVYLSHLLFCMGVLFFIWMPFFGKCPKLVFYLRLICSFLEPNGSLGETTYSQPNGNSNGGDPHGEYLCPDGTIMIGADVRAGDWLDYVIGSCEGLLVGGQGALSAPPMGNPNGGNPYGLQKCPAGYAITGMSAPNSFYPRRVSWLCSEISSQ